MAHFEPPYQNDHKRPARTEDLRYLDLIQYTGTLFRKTGLVDYTLSESVMQEVQAAEALFERQFEVEFDLVSRVKYALSYRQSAKWLYEYLLNRVDPALVLVVVSYGKEPFIEACKDHQVPVVELQHGVIHSHHVGYSFPDGQTKETFPDYLLIFGELWNDTVGFPIPDERVISVGYPYLEQFVTQYSDAESNRQILFISQGTIGEQLSKFAVDVSQHPDIGHDIVYKLHPGEYDRWQEEYPWLVDSEFTIIDSPDPPLYELFAQSSAQIGVYSTAIFEGLAFDTDTYVYNCTGAETLESLIESGAAKLISSADELALA